MTKLQSLRKQYTHLKPFERAVMGSKAIASQDECLIEALKPPTMWDALHTCWYERVFELIAFIAVYESQKADREYLSSALRMNSKPNNGTRHRQYAQPERINMQITRHKSIAWITALEALDKERGTACMAAAYTISRSYIEYILEQNKTVKANCANELSELSEFWLRLTKRMTF